MNLSKEALEATLMFWAGFVLGLFEWRVTDEDLALFTPVARLWNG